MGQYNTMVITDQGLAVLSKAQLESGSVTFTSIKAGNGTYQGTEELRKMTTLKQQKNSFPINSVTHESDSKLKIRCVLENTDVAVGYSISEIGIYGKVDKEEVLIAITTAVEPDFLPSADVAPSSIFFEIYLETLNCDNVSFEYTSPEGIYELAANADEKYRKIQENQENTDEALKNKVDKIDGKGLSTNDYTTTEKTKLSNIASGAEVNQNAFSNVKVGATTISADTKTDTLELVAGDNITITPDATNDKITISSTDTKYTHPNSGATAGTYRSVTVNAQGHVTAGSNPTITVAQGGTGATTASTARTNLGAASSNSPEFTNSVSMGRKSGSSVGTNSVALGFDVTASGDYSHAEEYKTNAIGNRSHAEGSQTNATGKSSHAEGEITTASGEVSHAEGKNTTASGTSSHAEGTTTTASGNYSHSEGYGTVTIGEGSHAEGSSLYNSSVQAARTVTVDSKTITVKGSTAYGENSHAEGCQTLAYGSNSHAEGYKTNATGINSHAEGAYSKAEGDYSHAGGYNTTALGSQYVIGHNNSSRDAGEAYDTAGTAFIIGNGNVTRVSNAFRVNYDGNTYATAHNATGADYAEYFEWSDGNLDKEDRVGLFVTFDDDNPEMIRLANEDDYILGIVSGIPSVIGNSDEDWRGRYILDDFGRYIEEIYEYEDIEITMETVEVEETVEVPYTDEDGNEQVKTETKTVLKEVPKETKVKKTGTRWKENPDYDSKQKYIQRSDRPEWDAIGMVGVLSVYDDGTCKVNGYCKCSKDGVATASETGYRVIKRVSDNIVKVVLK